MRRRAVRLTWVLGVIGGFILWSWGGTRAWSASYGVQIAAVKSVKHVSVLEKEGRECSGKVSVPVYLVKKEGSYALVLGRFENQAKAEEFKKSLASEYPDAFLVSWDQLQLVKEFGGDTPKKEVGEPLESQGKTPGTTNPGAQVKKAKKEAKAKAPGLPPGVYPKNSLVKITTRGNNLVFIGEEPWGFVDLEKFSPPLRYVVHLFNTTPDVTLDTLYSPVPGVDKVKVLYDYKEKETNVLVYPSMPVPVALEKKGKELILLLGRGEQKAEEAGGANVAPGLGLQSTFATPPGKKKVYRGKKISLEFKNADIRDVVRLLAEVSGLNFVVDPDVKGTVTVKLDNVPWDQALDVILKTNKLGMVVENGIVRIATLRSLSQEASERESARKAMEKAKPREIAVIRLNYTDADKVKDLVEDMLSDEGEVDYLERINGLMVKDNPERIAKIREFVKEIDTPTPQVQIGARIVEIVTTYLKELGIQWGFLWRQTRTNMSFPYSYGVGGGVTSAPAASQALTTMESVSGWSPASIAPGYVVDLPAAVTTGSGGAIAASLLNASETFGLDIRISALEEEGVARTVSNPKLVTLDNQEAEIRQGYEIPFATVSEAGTQTEFKEATLKLLVKPHIASNGDIIMDVEVSKDSPDFTHVTPDGVPIQTRSVKTSVRMRNGDTLIIGGIYEMTKSKSNNSVPGFSRIPLLSWLFKHKMENLEKRELLIFITPTVIKTGVAKGEG